jgi:hypothetical protein
VPQSEGRISTAGHGFAAPFFFGNCSGRLRGFDPGVPGGFEAGGAVSNPHTLMSMADAALHRRPSPNAGFGDGGTTRSLGGYDGTVDRLWSAYGDNGPGRPDHDAGGTVHRLASTTRHGYEGDGHPHFPSGSWVSNPAAGQPWIMAETNPMLQQFYRRYANADLAQLARLSVMYPPTSIEGQIIRRVLMAKRMALAPRHRCRSGPAFLASGRPRPV